MEVTFIYTQGVRHTLRLRLQRGWTSQEVLARLKDGRAFLKAPAVGEQTVEASDGTLLATVVSNNGTTSAYEWRTPPRDWA